MLTGALALLSVALSLALTDAPKANPNNIEPLATRPHMIGHTWHYMAPVDRPALPLPRGGAVRN